MSQDRCATKPCASLLYGRYDCCGFVDVELMVTSSSRRRRNKRKRPTIARRLLRALLLTTFVTLAVSVGAVLALRYVDPPTTAFMLHDQWSSHPGEPRGKLSYRWTNWSAISAQARLAMVAAEDQKFPVHYGFDVQSIRAALEDHQRGDPKRAGPRGASTISQQVAKNLFLWPGRSWLRKVLEVYVTALIEGLWPKRRILEVYLNVAQLGDNIYGVEAAAQAFFTKPARDLSAQEAALMAAVLPNPVRLSIARPSTYVRKRQRWILRQMRQLGGRAYLENL